MKAVIMCGGQGTRLKPLTDLLPKPLVKIVNRPVLDIIIEKLISSNITDIYISLGYKAQDIIDFCESKSYQANIRFFIENKPLGTAGSVKNSLNNSDEDFFVLSGDNIFDIDLNELYNFHVTNYCDATLCAIKTVDPREYGMIISDENDVITEYIEKPNWEYAISDYVNSGIYVLNGKILDMIPENINYDFSKDLFPNLIKNNFTFKCYKTDKYWGDMGEISSLLTITKELLSHKDSRIKFDGVYYGKDTFLLNGAEIKAPSLIGKNTEIMCNSTIGPFTVIGNNCKIQNNCLIKGAVIGSSCNIGADCEISETVIDDNVIISDNCLAEKHSVIGNGCEIDRFSKINSGIRIFPGIKIEAYSDINKDVLNQFNSRRTFDIYGIYEKIAEFTIINAVELGAAIASVDSVKKIGIGCNSNQLSDNYKKAIISGLRSIGKTVYDFGEIFKSQAHFFSSYCKLDFFIFLNTDGENIKISFYGRLSMPVSSDIARQINNNLKTNSFKFIRNCDCLQNYNMSLFYIVYKSYFKSLAGEFFNKYNLIAESENNILNRLLEELVEENHSQRKNKTITVFFNGDGKEMYITENDIYFSSDNIMLFLCHYEMAQGNDVIIPEYATDLIDEYSDMFSGKAIRMYENDNNIIEIDNNIIHQNIWVFDSVLMLAKLLGILSQSQYSLAELFENQPNFALSKSEISISNSNTNISKIIYNSGLFEKNKKYFVFDNRKGRIKLRQLGDSKKIRIISQSYDIESAKELSDLFVEKLKTTIIDKDE